MNIFSKYEKISYLQDTRECMVTISFEDNISVLNYRFYSRYYRFPSVIYTLLYYKVEEGKAVIGTVV